jgi:putative transposase
MRHSQHTENEIFHLLYEADMGVSIASICSTAHISLRTFYRWRKRYGSLTPAALLRMKELQLENQRLKALVNKLTEVPNTTAAVAVSPKPQRVDCGSTASTMPHVSGRQLGTSLGRFASVRGMR